MISSLARRLLRHPAFSVGVTVLLAWGIGAGTAILSLVDAVSIRSLKVWHAEELVRVVQHNPAFRTETAFPHVFFEALQTRNAKFSSITGELDAQAVLSEPAPAQEIRVSFVTSQFFSLLGVPALYGRVFMPAEYQDASRAEPAVLSYSFWNSRFHSDPQVLGQLIFFNDHPFVIVGVMPKSFHGFSADTTSDVSVPSRTYGLVMTRKGEGDPPQFSIMARLAPEVTRSAAESATLAIWQQTIGQYWSGRIPEFGQSARDNLADDLRLGIQLENEQRGDSLLRERYGSGWILMGGAAMVLEALLCINLATIVLSRNAANTNDIAMRMALGASRGRVLRMLLSESALLTAIGTAGGIVVGYLLIPLLVYALPPVRNVGTALLTNAIDVGRDSRPLVIGLVLGTVTFIGFGWVPALIASRKPLKEGLPSGHLSHRLATQRQLLVLQVMLCTLLLVCASLLARSFTRLRGVNPGFIPERLVSFSFNPNLRGYTDDQANLLRERLMSQVSALPGVESVAAARFPLMRGTGIKVSFAPQGVTIPASAPLNATLESVSDGFFATMGMNLIEGRNLPQNQERGLGRPTHVVVNQALARLFFPGANPIGRHFGPSGAQSTYEVVGVVSDAKFRSLREVPPPTVYADAASLGRFNCVLYVRSRLSAETLIEPVLKIFAANDPTLPVTDAVTMEEELDAAAAGERLNARIASAFALSAVILAGLGIYGFAALFVTQRRRELAIHLAVGASRSRVITLASRPFLFAVAAGIIAGLGSALFLTPVLRSMLYDISPSDPTSLMISIFGVILMAVLGSLGPLLRTLSIEPAVTLRQTE